MKHLKRYLIISTFLAIALFIGGCITIVTVDMPKLPHIFENLPHFSFNLFPDTDEDVNFNPSSDETLPYIHEETFTQLPPHIEFDLKHSNISIYETDDTFATLTIKTTTPEIFNIKATSDELTIDNNSDICIGFCFDETSSDISLTVPKNSTINELELETNQGDVTLLGGLFNEIETDTANGHVNIENIKTTSLSVNQVSGITTLKDIAFKELELEHKASTLALKNLSGHVIEGSAVSSNLTLTDVYAKVIELDKTSSSLTFKNSDKTYEISDLKIENLNESDIVDVKTGFNTSRR